MPKEILKEHGGVKDYKFVSDSGFIKVPFELVCNHIYFKVKVNGSSYLSFLLDTGARSSYLDSSKALELTIKKLDRGEAKRVSGYEDILLFKPDSLMIGPINSSQERLEFSPDENLTLFNQTLTGISFSQVEKFDGKELDGILGYDFFCRFVVEIDYASQILVLYQPRNFNYTGNGEIIKINLELNIPKIKAIFDGEPEGIFKIDIGCRNSLELYATFAKKHGILERHPQHLETFIGFGVTGPTKGVMGRIGSFKLGSFIIDAPVTGFHLNDDPLFGPSKIAGKIGGGMLKRFKVIFDYSRYRIILEKNSNYDLGDRYNTSGIQLIQEDKKILVYQVMTNSPAEKAKIKKDDELLSINDIPVSDYSLQNIREILNQHEGAKIELELRRKAKTKRVRLILKELI